MKKTLITLIMLVSFTLVKAQQIDTVKKNSADTTVVDNPATPPEFPGGMPKLNKALFKFVHYPDKAKEYNIQGKVILTFVIEKDGSISNIKVKKSVAPILDDEVIRIIKLVPKFNPGKDQDGVPVRCYYDLPYSFTLKSED